MGGNSSYKKINRTLDLSLFWWPESTAVPARIWVSSPRASRNWNTTLLSPEVDGLWVLLSLGVNTNIDIGKEAVLDLGTDQGDLHDGVITALLAHVEEEVVGVLGLNLLVCVVWGYGLDPGEEVLFNVELTNVRDSAALDGVVGKKFSTVVDDS